MEKLVNGHVSIISGGGSGMGQAACKLFAAEGATVIAADYNLDNAQKTVDDIIAAGGKAEAFQIDISNKARCEEMADYVFNKYGKIDDLVTFAGGTFDGDPSLDDEARFHKTYDVNAFGTFWCAFACSKYMKEAGSGSIVLISSSGAFNPSVPAYEYHTSKAAVEGFTLQMAFDLAPFGVRVNCMKPGLCKTAFYDALGGADACADMFKGSEDMEIPMGRAGEPEDYANVALFYCSKLGSYVTGQRMYVAGGMGDIKAYGQSPLLSTVAKNMVQNQ